MKATWNGATIAQSDETVVVEGNHYFPRASVDAAMLKDSATTSVCPWKGTAHYYSIVVDGAENRDAAWYYPETKSAAAQIKDRIAFWKGVWFLNLGGMRATLPKLSRPRQSLSSPTRPE